MATRKRKSSSTKRKTTARRRPRRSGVSFGFKMSKGAEVRTIAMFIALIFSMLIISSMSGFGRAGSVLAGICAFCLIVSVTMTDVLKLVAAAYEATIKVLGKL